MDDTYDEDGRDPIAWTTWDEYGNVILHHDARGMRYPGRCRWCGRVYDGATVTVVQRYVDCSVWRAPCCGNLADDRPEGWGGSFFPILN